MLDNIESTKRKYCPIAMCSQMRQNINRYIPVWQLVGVLAGAFVVLVLVEKNVMSLDIAVSMIILIAVWLLALDVHYYYAEHSGGRNPKNHRQVQLSFRFRIDGLRSVTQSWIDSMSSRWNRRTQTRWLSMLRLTVLVNCLVMLLTCLHCTVFAQALTKKEAHAVTYYVSSRTGNDSNDGLSPKSAWRSIQRVNAGPLEPGDTLLFERGRIFRGQLIPSSGGESGPVTYGAYGKGPKPRIYGSINRSAKSYWRSSAENVWETDDITCDAGNIIFDDGKCVGIKVWNRADVNHPNRFWYDKDHKSVVLYCEQNPGNRYRSIEIALTKHIIDESNRHDVTYKDLDLRYGSAHGIGGTRTSHIIVRNCDFSFIGGGLLDYWDSRPVRYGNGVEFWEEAHDNLVDGCRFWEIYDTAVTNQGNSKNSQTDIRYTHNVIWNCGMGAYECWNRPEDSTIERVYFENNTCVNSGYGWSHDQRPDKQGRHILLFENQAKTKSVYIRNNIFYQIKRDDSESCLRMFNDWLADLNLDHNCWYQPAGIMVALPSPLSSYQMVQFAEYQAKTGNDTHSIAADPHFIDLSKQDFRPAPNSPVCHLAVDGSYAGALPPAAK